MLLSQTVASLAASVLLFISGTPALTPPEQPIKQEVIAAPAVPATPISSVYPVDTKGTLIPWKTLLDRDPELYELASCESQFRPNVENHGDALITGYPSYGLLQFQPGTFLGGVKRYKAYPGASNEEILAAIKDPYLQIYVARRMINDGGGQHWTCHVKMGLAKKYPIWKTSTTSVDTSKKLD